VCPNCEVASRAAALAAVAAVEEAERRRVEVIARDIARKVGRCRLTVSKPVLKAPMRSALETRIS